MLLVLQDASAAVAGMAAVFATTRPRTGRSEVLPVLLFGCDLGAAVTACSEVGCTAGGGGCGGAADGGCEGESGEGCGWKCGCGSGIAAGDDGSGGLLAKRGEPGSVETEEVTDAGTSMSGCEASAFGCVALPTALLAAPPSSSKSWLPLL